jgi:hypothetical protein
MFDTIIAESKWSESHGANGSYAGVGALYYSIPYVLMAKKCVCLGSGAGFVPKLMLEAQKELVKSNLIPGCDVHLVDANIGPWGRPVYGDTGIIGYDDIQFHKMTTDEACELFDEIDYLHVDADHTYDQVLQDLNNYGNRMSKSGVWAITVHDTYNKSDGDHPEIGSYLAAKDWATANYLNIINFPFGCGTALIMPKVELCIDGNTSSPMIFM